MSVLESELSLQPISPEEPCGPNLQYDPDFIELEKVAQGKPEQQYGDTIIPAEPPDWKEVKRQSLALHRRTKDLRVACHLARALVETDGLAGFCASLALTRGYIEEYWDQVHPLLDPDDDNDPTERVNIIASLADKTTTVAQLLQAPMIRSSVMGTFSMRDVMVARGEAPHAGDGPPPEMSEIEASFVDGDLETLRQSIATLEQGCSDAVAIEDLITRQAGSSKAVSMEALSETLRTICDFMLRQLRRRESDQATPDDLEADTSVASPGEADAPARASGPAISGEIRTREDVLRTLDKICEYYDRHEPSSPVPMLIKRAKRLATKSFLDILEDLTPDGLSQARLIGGLEQPSGEE
jgi:type VI secretion system protein ImpA